MDIIEKLRETQDLTVYTETLARMHEAADEIERLRKWIESQHYDRLSVPFICGVGGKIQDDHLPERIMVCPAYGSDIVVMFKRVSKN